MSGMIAYFSSHIYFLLILVVLAVLAVFACIKAGKASSLRRKENEAIMKKLEQDTALRREFDNLDEAKAKNAEPEKLFKGVALGLCRDIEKSSNMLSTFDSFTEEQKKIYSLYFVFEDSAEKLSGFFKLNGKPLTTYAQQAVNEIYSGDIAEVFNSECIAYDEDDETTSLIPAEIEKQDVRFSELVSQKDMWSPAAEYIIENIGSFIKQ